MELLACTVLLNPMCWGQIQFCRVHTPNLTEWTVRGVIAMRSPHSFLTGVLKTTCTKLKLPKRRGLRAWMRSS